MKNNKSESVAARVIRIGVTLFLICAVVAGLLALFNNLTKDKIAENEQKSRDMAMIDVFGDTFGKSEELKYDASKFKGFYRILDKEGKEIGYCVCLIAKGYDSFEIAVGFENDGAVKGVSIQNNNETKGYGADQIGSGKPDSAYLSKFIALKTAEQIANVDTVAGATKTTSGIRTAVDSAFALVSSEVSGK